MIRHLSLSVSMLVMAVTMTPVSAGTNKPPHDENCREWILLNATNANWVNAPKGRYWVCIRGDSNGYIASTGGSVRGLSHTAPRTGLDTDTGHLKGNNGLGNGLDPQPPGNPKPNDT